MAYDPAVPQDNQLHPALEQTVGAISDPQAQDIAGQAAVDIQQHVNMTTAADVNTEAGNQFVNNLAATKNNLTGMASADPTSIPLALKLANDLIPPLLLHANVDPDTQADTHSAILSHFNQQIVHAGAIRAADFSPDMVQGIIDRYGEHLDDGDADKLTKYATALDGARQMDRTIGTQQAQMDAVRGSQLSAFRVGTSLLDQKRESVQFPDDFAANLIRDQNIQPADKAALYTAVTNLHQNGDQPTNPYTFVQRLQDVVNPGVDVNHNDLMSHVGKDLSYADAHMLQGLNLTTTPAGNRMAQGLLDNVTQAQRYLAGSGSRAGDAAFGRYMDWLLPSYRTSGAAGLDPGSDSYLFKTTSLAQFRNHEDAVPPNPGGRQPLGQIFAGDVVPLNPAGSFAPFGTPGNEGSAINQLRNEGGTGTYFGRGNSPTREPTPVRRGNDNG